MGGRTLPTARLTFKERPGGKAAMNDAREAAEALVRTWYASFNARDRPAMLALLTEDVIHDVNQGAREIGLEACARFLERMDQSYVEELTDLVVMADETGTRAAAEFVVRGQYIATDAGLPMARGQTYELPAGAFFALREGRIARVSTYYNLPAWVRMVQGT
jgi:steroid delta-isomerase-like uncharacterized protein